jgi:hypothetical protein
MEMARILTHNAEENLPNMATSREPGTGISAAMAVPTRRIRKKTFIMKKEQWLSRLY